MGTDIAITNVLLLAKIAYQCGLEITKEHARNLLQQKLLQPRKQQQPKRTIAADDDDDDNTLLPRVETAEENIELNWSLSNLQHLSKLLQSYAELRAFVWETAIIVYLPHDLDVTISSSLVSNSLFPYLLREGMMQMLIVESIEKSAAAPAPLSSSTDAAMMVVDTLFVNKTTLLPSTVTPRITVTTPLQQQQLITQEELEYCLHSIMDHVETFQQQKKRRTEKKKGGIGGGSKTVVVQPAEKATATTNTIPTSEHPT